MYIRSNLGRLPATIRTRRRAVSKRAATSTIAYITLTAQTMTSDSMRQRVALLVPSVASGRSPSVGLFRHGRATELFIAIRSLLLTVLVVVVVDVFVAGDGHVRPSVRCIV